MEGCSGDGATNAAPAVAAIGLHSIASHRSSRRLTGCSASPCKARRIVELGSFIISSQRSGGGIYNSNLVGIASAVYSRSKLLARTPSIRGCWHSRAIVLIALPMGRRHCNLAQQRRQKSAAGSTILRAIPRRQEWKRQATSTLPTPQECRWLLR